MASVDAEGAAAERPASSSAFKGEFFLSRNEFQRPVCQRFTRNLNQFRKLDFGTCHPRLSEKYPEFSRPKWEEIPFELALAEEVIKDHVSLRRTSAEAAKRADTYWANWKEGVKPFLASGQARMWRIRIDLDGDGLEETIIRMVPGYGHPVKMETEPPFSCDYNLGSLHMRDNVHQEVADRFNTGLGDDIIHFNDSKRYYIVEWVSAGPAYMEIDIGAAAGVIIKEINWVGGLRTGADICLIDWVPTGKYKPLNRSR